jgi:hypothetical protein
MQDRCILAGLAAVDEARRDSREKLAAYMDACRDEIEDNVPEVTLCTTSGTDGSSLEN